MLNQFIWDSILRLKPLHDAFSGLPRLKRMKMHVALASWEGMASPIPRFPKMPGNCMAGAAYGQGRRPRLRVVPGVRYSLSLSL